MPIEAEVPIIYVLSLQNQKSSMLCCKLEGSERSGCGCFDFWEEKEKTNKMIMNILVECVKNEWDEFYIWNVCNKLHSIKKNYLIIFLYTTKF